MKQGNALPIISQDGLTVYLQRIRRYPMLTPEQETTFACEFRDNDDATAAEKLITSHLRLVAKIAMSYRGYGLPINELISEGNVGLLQSVKRFDPDKGFRLATYAMWWIRAAIQEYILHSWSLVKMGTTAAQKNFSSIFGNSKARCRRLTKAICDRNRSNSSPQNLTSPKMT